MLQKAFASKGIIWGLFGSLGCYLILRAWFVAPMHDEAATFLHYIEPGEIWGPTALKDANNHLLNSWLGRFIYLLGGHSFFALRLPALVAFALYFWTSHRLVRNLSLGTYSLVVFLALNTIPWITDYFAYTRGYGLAIACFMAALASISGWLHSGSVKHYTWMIIAIYLAVFANLTYLVSSLLLVGFSLVYLLINWKTRNRLQRVLPFILSFAFFVALIPLIRFSFDLKEAGALYYGSLDGLWWVTGKSISHVVLFYDHNWLRYAYLLLGLIAALLLLNRWRTIGFRKFIGEESTWIACLIIGNLAAILFLAKVMQVNYPEDRAAMYLVPLCILGIAGSVYTVPKIRPVLHLFWIFPVLLLFKMNLHTSVFSPDDRMTEAFYTKATKDLKADETVVLYPIMQLTYPLWERKYRSVKHPAGIQKDFEPYSDLVLTKTTYLFPKDNWQKDYRVIAEDKASSYIALKRKKPVVKTLLFDTILPTVKTRAEFVDILKIPIDSNWYGQALQIDIDADIQTGKHLNTYNLVVATNDRNNEPFRYHYYNLRWFEGSDAGHFHLHYPYTAKQFNKDESQLIIYIWNREHRETEVTKARVRLKKLKL